MNVLHARQRAIHQSTELGTGMFVMGLRAGRDFALVPHGFMANALAPVRSRVLSFAVEMRNLVWVIADVVTGQCVVIDACWDVAGIDAVLQREGLTLTGLVVTHSHVDHVGGIPPPPFDKLGIRVEGLATMLARHPHAVAYIHSLDVPDVVAANPGIPLSRITHTYDGFELTVGCQTRLTLVHTPGHTPGSQCVVANGCRIFTGDTLFAGSFGRVDLHGGNGAHMASTLRRGYLATLPDSTVVYPGHSYGGEWTTIGYERANGIVG
ncbi:Metallo-hydrolase/oxidoreductase, partial [Ramicandelaber brevisporus]